MIGSSRAAEVEAVARRLRIHGSERAAAAGVADVFALPSLGEGLSYALLEAMAEGKATRVSDAPGNPDAVGDAGLVVGAGDVEALAASPSSASRTLSSCAAGSTTTR